MAPQSARNILFEDLPQLSGEQTRPSHYIRTRPPWAVSCPASECRASSARTCQGVQPASMRHAPRDVVTVYNWRKHWRITHMGTEQKNQGKDTKNRLLSCARFRHKSTHDSRASSLFFTHLLLIRSRSLKPKRYLIGRAGEIWGSFVIGSVFEIMTDVNWRALQSSHCWYVGFRLFRYMRALLHVHQTDDNIHKWYAIMRLYTKTTP